MLLLCDEPLLTLDPANAKLVAALIDRRRRDADTTVIVVTHEINPILPYVDRVLYLVDGRFRIGTVEQVMTTETLSRLYRADIQVVKVKDRYVVVGDARRARLMNYRLADMLDHLFAFDITAHLLRHDFVQQALVAAALLGLVAGLIGPFIVMRQMSFAVHGSSELSLTGAAFALLVGFEVGLGALIGSALAAALFGVLGQRARERDSVTGVVLAFGLGLAVLFIHLYPGRTATSFALLTGQIVGVGYSGLAMLAAGLPARHRRAGGLLPATVVRHRRSGGRGRPRRAGTRAGHRVRRAGRGGGGPGRADRRGAAGDVVADHAGGRGGPGGHLTRQRRS